MIASKPFLIAEFPTAPYSPTRDPHTRTQTLTQPFATEPDLGRAHESLCRAFRARANIAIVGSTGSGKTSLLSALLALAPRGERVVLLEDTPEIRPVRENWVALRYSEGGRVRAGDCLRAALRLRPDRIVMTEVRGAEAFELLGATSSGHGGVLTTFHAHGHSDAALRFGLMASIHPAAAQYTADQLAAMAVSAFEVLVAMDRGGEGPVITACGPWGRAQRLP